MATNAVDAAMFPKNHPGWVNALAFSPDGKTLTTVTQSGTIRFWDTTNGGQRFPAIAHKHVGTVLAFSPDGRTLASGNADDTINLWDIDTRTQMLMRPKGMGTPTTLTFSPDGHTLAIGSSKDTIHLWDIGAAEQVLIHHNRMETPTTLAFSPDGRTLTSAGYSQTMIWCRMSEAARYGELLKLMKRFPKWFAFSPDGTILASVDRNNVVRLWDTINGELLSTFVGDKRDVWAIAFSPDGSLFASGGWDAFLLWDVSRHRKLVTSKATIVQYRPWHFRLTGKRW